MVFHPCIQLVIRFSWGIRGWLKEWGMFPFMKQNLKKKWIHIENTRSCCLYCATIHVSSHETSDAVFLFMPYLLRRT